LLNLAKQINNSLNKTPVQVKFEFSF